MRGNTYWQTQAWRTHRRGSHRVAVSEIHLYISGQPWAFYRQMFFERPLLYASFLTRVQILSNSYVPKPRWEAILK